MKKTDFWSYPPKKKTHPWHQVLWLQNVEDAFCKFIGQVKCGTMAAMDSLTLLEGIAKKLRDFDHVCFIHPQRVASRLT